MTPQEAVLWLRANWWPNHELWELEADLPQYALKVMEGMPVLIRANQRDFQADATYFFCQLAEHINERRGRG